MFQRICAVGAAMALIGLPSGASSADARALSADLATSSTMVAGTVASASGAAVPGVVVELHAWPSSAVLKKLKPGQAVPWKLLATTRSTSAGTYALTVPRAALVSAAVDNGWANLEVDSAAGEEDFAYNTTGLAAGRAAPAVTVNLRSDHTVTSGSGYEYNYCITPGSPWIYVHGYFPEPWAIVGQGYILKQASTKGDYQQFSYAQGSTSSQTSTLGVGASGYGTSAGFSKTGTNTESAEGAEAFKTFHQQNVLYETEFQLGLYRMDCLVPEPPKSRPKQHGYCPTMYKGSYVGVCVWKVRAMSWWAGARYVFTKNAPATPRDDCAFQEAGTTYSTDRGKAIEWSEGYEVGVGLDIKGVNLKTDFETSAQTGYDTNAHIVYGFPDHSGWVCGTNNGPNKAAQVVARGNLP
jgi:hypothetical protein